MAGRGRGRGRGEPLTGAKLFLQQSELEYGIDPRNRPRPPLFPPICLHSTGDSNLLKLQKKQESERQRILLEGSGAGSGAGGAVDPGRSKELAEEEAALKRLTDGIAGKRSVQAVYLIEKGREMQHRMESSAFYVRPTKYVPDVIRSSDWTRPPPRIDASAVLSNCLGGRKETEGVGGGRFVPEELVSGQVLLAGGDLGGKGGKVGMEELKARERMKQGDGNDDDDGGFDEGGDIYADEGEESEVEDYGANHYDSEREGSDDGDDVAVF